MLQNGLKYGHIAGYDPRYCWFFIKDTRGNESTAYLSAGRDPTIVNGVIVFGGRGTRETKEFPVKEQVVYEEGSPGRVRRFALLSKWNKAELDLQHLLREETQKTNFAAN